MKVTSLYFLVFVLVSTLIFDVFFKKKKVEVLLFISIFFILHFKWIDVIALSSIVIFTWVISKRIGKWSFTYLLGIIGVLVLLLFFKYWSFGFVQLDQPILPFLPGISSQLAIIGISFYSLQCLAWLIETKRNEIGTYAFSSFLLYITFFPKFLAGPIVLPNDFIQELNKGKKLDNAIFLNGVNRIVLGLFKKLVIADHLAVFVTNVYDNYQGQNGLTLVIATFLFCFQLYFDFSGYSDIAIGVAGLFGISLPENFNRPFLASSITEFWRRWHMSLMNWLKNYIFQPLAFELRATGSFAICIALIVTFLFSGLWHGIKLTFVVWALIHGVIMCFEFITSPYRTRFKKNIFKIFGLIFTFLIFSFSNIFFRSDSLAIAVEFIRQIFQFQNFLPQNFIYECIAVMSGGGEIEKLYHFLIYVVLLFFALFFEEKLMRHRRGKKSLVQIGLIILLILVFGEMNDSSQFIYNCF